MAFARCLILLTYNVNQGTVIAGLPQVDTVPYWYIVSNINIGLSALLFTFVARYLSKSRETPITLKLHYGSFGCRYSLR
jgi:hypothetical protein